MTAIAGIIRLDGAPIDNAEVERMRGLLTPYGRDAQDTWRRGSAALVRTLLRTTPEDSLDRQPLVAPAGDTVLLFDGRLDNRDELAHALGLSKPETARLADSDLALRACLRWDTASLEHLFGDFAIACWQPARRRLWLARDPIGYRPLYWHRQPGFFAFASLPKALFALPGVPRALGEERLADQLMLLPMNGPESFFKDIYRVEPGQCLVLDGERVASHRYHRFDPEREIHFANDADYVEAFREHLERAVACRLRSNGPIASHLSSGFDSATIAAIAARQLGERGQGLIGYTAVPREGFAGPVLPGRHGDESAGARALAARFANIDHVLIRTDGVSPLDHLEDDTATMDRAPLNPCNMVWMDAIQADAARRGAKVLLTGQMGNMSLSYTGKPYLPALFGQGRWLTWWREAAALKRVETHRRWRDLLLQSVGAYLPAGLWLSLERMRGREWDASAFSAIHPRFRERMTERVRDSGWDMSFRPWADGRRMRIEALKWFDIAEYFTAAQALGIEQRDPTSDLRLIEFCLAVPDRQYLRAGQDRWLLRRAMADILPAEILDAKTKGLQAADWYESATAALPQLRRQLARLEAHEGAGDYLDLNALRALLDDWPTAGWGRKKLSQNYRSKLLRGLAVGAFILYVEQNNR